MTDEQRGPVPGQAIVVTPHRQTTTEILNEAVGTDHTPAYVAAMVQLLPPDFQDNPIHAIALGIRAKKSGLDPFTEIHAWKNERGTLQFQIARDGFIYIAANDPNVESLEFQHVYEGEEFTWEKAGDGTISITHHGGLVKGALLGAYCCAHMKEGKADHLEMRIVENYRHLMKKANWQYLPEMLITRVIGACVRLVCPDRAGGLYSDADAQLAEVAAVTEVVTKRSRRATVEKIEELTAQGPTLEDLQASEAKAEIESRYQCDECERSFNTQQGLAGHKRIHRRADKTPGPTEAPTSPVESISSPAAEEPSSASSPDTSGEAELELPEGYDMFTDRGGQFVLVEPSGSRLMGRYLTYNDAALAARNHADTPDPTSSPAVPGPEPSPSPEASSQPTTTPPGGLVAIKLADIYAWCRTHNVKATEVENVVNDAAYADEFEPFRSEGAEKISTFNLNSDARRTLLELLQQRTQV